MTTPVKTIAFHTLGCKTNQLETSTLSDQFAGQGWQTVSFDDPASVYVINTCTVTERADQDSRRAIRRAKLGNPDACVVVTGCYAQVAPGEVAGLPGVNFVIGNAEKDRIPEILAATPIPRTPLVRVSDIDKSRVLEGASRAAIDRTRGSLKIQDGCDYKCTYCIIWEARGPSRSLPVEDLKIHLKRMIDEGFKEIGLTGINIGQYDDEGADLSDLLGALMRVEGDFRLRLTSLDPLEVTSRLIDTVAEGVRLGKLCPHFHLSAQSAEDTVLKRMARRHHAAEMLSVCDEIARKIPGCSVGSDIIVGFPGENAEKFEITYRNLEHCAMNYFHVFSFSRRKGTPAAAFPEQAPEREKKQRAQRLRALSDAKSLAYRTQFVGQTLSIIVEAITPKNIIKGMSENYIHISLSSGAQVFQPNDQVQVRVDEVKLDETHASVLQERQP